MENGDWQRNSSILQRQYIQCFNVTNMCTTFLIFHLVIFLLSNITGFSLFTRHSIDQLSASPLSSPPSIYSLTNLMYQLCSLHSSTSLPTTSILQDPNLTNTLHPSLMFSKDMGSLSSHITCMKLSHLRTLVVMRTLVARRKEVQWQWMNFKFKFHFHQEIMKSWKGFWIGFQKFWWFGSHH